MDEKRGDRGRNRPQRELERRELDAELLEESLDEQDRGDRDEDVAQSVNAGIDMVMAPDSYREFITSLKKNVGSGRVPMTRIDDAVRRILVAKFKLGLFEQPMGAPQLLAKIGSPEHRAVARQAVRESQVLLVNKNATLPLASTLDAEANPANAAVPVLMAHGTHDPVIPMAAGESSRDALRARGYPVDWRSYPMPHSVCAEEVDDIRQWLLQTLPALPLA